MRIALILSLLLATSCAPRVEVALPPPPTNTTVIRNDVAVPVLCKFQANRPRVELDSTIPGQRLEAQNTALRKTIAQQRAYEIALEAGIIGCGGKITKQ